MKKSYKWIVAVTLILTGMGQAKIAESKPVETQLSGKSVTKAVIEQPQSELQAKYIEITKKKSPKADVGQKGDSFDNPYSSIFQQIRDSIPTTAFGMLYLKATAKLGREYVGSKADYLLKILRSNLMAKLGVLASTELSREERERAAKDNLDRSLSDVSPMDIEFLGVGIAVEDEVWSHLFDIPLDQIRARDRPIDERALQQYLGHGAESGLTGGPASAPAFTGAETPFRTPPAVALAMCVRSAIGSAGSPAGGMPGGGGRGPDPNPAAVGINAGGNSSGSGSRWLADYGEGHGPGSGPSPMEGGSVNPCFGLAKQASVSDPDVKDTDMHSEIAPTEVDDNFVDGTRQFTNRDDDGYEYPGGKEHISIDYIVLNTGTGLQVQITSVERQFFGDVPPGARDSLITIGGHEIKPGESLGADDFIAFISGSTDYKFPAGKRRAKEIERLKQRYGYFDPNANYGICTDTYEAMCACMDCDAGGKDSEGTTCSTPGPITDSNTFLPIMTMEGAGGGARSDCRVVTIIINGTPFSSCLCLAAGATPRPTHSNLVFDPTPMQPRRQDEMQTQQPAMQPHDMQNSNRDSSRKLGPEKQISPQESRGEAAPLPSP